jgi:hypothetical protein
VSRTYYPRWLVVLDVLLEDFAGGDDSTTYTHRFTPHELEVDKNDHRTADTIRLTSDYQDFPFDPRTIRHCKVVAYMGHLDDPDASELDLEDPRYLAFAGYIDEPSTRLGAEGETVEMEGRDMTCLFLDRPWVGGALDVDRPLSEVVDEVIASIPGAEGLAVELADGIDDLNLSGLLGRKKWAPEPNDDTWTVLVTLCGVAGLVPTFELDTLRIYAAGQVGGTRAAFVYGQNVASLRYSRKLQSKRQEQIEVRCWDPARRRATAVKYPPEPIVTSKKISKKGKVKTDTAPIRPWFVSGSYSEADLEALAQRLYEEASRSEVEGELETRDMTDLGEDVDLWALKNGDALEVRLGRDDPSIISGLSHGEAVAHLVGRGYAEPMAAALVTAWEQAEQASTTFYVRSARHRMTLTDGYSLSVQFLNYAVDIGG